MKSKASIKSHPLHPILIPFPVALLTFTFVFDLLGYFRDHDSFRQTASYLQVSGIVMGLLAAVPGIIDYLGAVPPDSSAKKRAAKHGLLNSTNLVLFFAAWLYKGREDASPAVYLALEALGLVLMFVAGWLGGTLVYRNQIGVDVRYGHAGKWNEAHLKKESGPIVVAEADELNINAMKLLHIGDRRIVLGRTEDGYTAFDDRCPHKGGSLAGGALMCGKVQCPWHGSQFDVRTGAVTANPSKEGIRVYPVAEHEGKIYLTL